MKLKVMTYNIAGGRDYTSPEKKKPFHPEACASVIRKVSPDICGLNEVDYKLPRSGRLKLAEVIGNMLGYESRFAPAVTWGPGTYGNGFLSRHPIVEFEIFPIQDPQDKSEPVYYEPRVILHAAVDFSGSVVDVYVSHFGLAKTEEESAVKTLVGILQEAKRPVILMGDFNVTPDNPVLSPIRELLTDSFDVYPNKDASTIFTYPSTPEAASNPETKLKIDYIFVSRDIRVDSVEILETQESDHKPYIAYIELP
ncbi:MAG: hypothetical protein DBY04_04680 [Clostridiales bacterium]|nr:MAG: hypothetical protein DBY04_04680 [Clostridiales bacterium]